MVLRKKMRRKDTVDTDSLRPLSWEELQVKVVNAIKGKIVDKHAIAEGITGYTLYLQKFYGGEARPRDLQDRRQKTYAPKRSTIQPVLGTLPQHESKQALPVTKQIRKHTSIPLQGENETLRRRRGRPRKNPLPQEHIIRQDQVDEGPKEMNFNLAPQAVVGSAAIGCSTSQSKRTKMSKIVSPPKKSPVLNRQEITHCDIPGFSSSPKTNSIVNPWEWLESSDEE